MFRIQLSKCFFLRQLKQSVTKRDGFPFDLATKFCTSSHSNIKVANNLPQTINFSFPCTHYCQNLLFLCTGLKRASDSYLKRKHPKVLGEMQGTGSLSRSQMQIIFHSHGSQFLPEFLILYYLELFIQVPNPNDTKIYLCHGS